MDDVTFDEVSAAVILEGRGADAVGRTGGKCPFAALALSCPRHVKLRAAAAAAAALKVRRSTQFCCHVLAALMSCPQTHSLTHRYL